MFCLRCDGEIKKDQKACVNDEGDFAHDECLGWDDFDENWVEFIQ